MSLSTALYVIKDKKIHTSMLLKRWPITIIFLVVIPVPKMALSLCYIRCTWFSVARHNVSNYLCSRNTPSKKHHEVIHDPVYIVRLYWQWLQHWIIHCIQQILKKLSWLKKDEQVYSICFSLAHVSKDTFDHFCVEWWCRTDINVKPVIRILRLCVHYPCRIYFLKSYTNKRCNR